MRYIMQDKHVVTFRTYEDRDIFINKIKYPKTVYQIEGTGEVEEGDIVLPNIQVTDWIIAKYIVDNYDNLPEYVIFSQANPNDHVHEMLLAIDSTFTGGFGSFAYARSMYNQWTSNWDKCFPVRLVAHMLGIGFKNDDNCSKFIYPNHCGCIFYVSRNRILEKPKSFYQNIIDCDNDEKLFEILENLNYPSYFWNDINKYFPDLRNLSKEEKLKIRVSYSNNKNRKDYFALAMEPLWFLVFANKELFDLLDNAQAAIGNKLYFDTSKNSYDPNFRFLKFPYSFNSQETSINFKTLENDWFKWDCPYYLKWREKLIEKTIWEGQQRGFDGKELLEFYKSVGYKHISL